MAVDNSLAGFFGNLFDTSSYPARWSCGEWTPIEGWLHIASDVGIFLAYLAIPLAIVYALRRRRDVPLHGVLLLFAAFILSCGTGHLLEAVIFYHPVYRVAGLLKLATAIISWATALVLIRLLPTLLELPSLASRNELLERTAKAKSEFLANMSHEIRTPMTAILGYADILADSVGTHPGTSSHTTQRDAALTIQKNSRHLLEIINDVLDMSKIDAGKVSIESIDTNLIKLVEEVRELLQGRAQGKGIALRVEYDGLVPATVKTDPTRLRQILLNLLGNAVKFTEVGEVSLCVGLITKPDEPTRLRFQVRDTGFGMTDEQLVSVRRFEAFVQADGSTSRRFGGTGLGLKISRSLAQMLGGEIEIESEFGLGSTFTLTVDPGDLTGVERIEPPTAAAEAPMTGRRDSKTPDVTTGPLAGMRVLLVEDGPDNQCLIRYFLEQAGAEVRVAENGRIAVGLTIAHERLGDHFDLILMDMQMPVLDGYSATRELREGHFTKPIVALTAHAMPEDRQRCLDIGCDDYLSKPVDRVKLIEACARYRATATSTVG